MDIVALNDAMFSFPPTAYVKRNGRWVNEQNGNQLIINTKCPAFSIECKGTATMEIREHALTEGLLEESAAIRIVYDGESGGVLRITKRYPEGSQEEIDRFTISIMNPHHSFFWEKPTEVV